MAISATLQKIRDETWLSLNENTLLGTRKYIVTKATYVYFNIKFYESYE